MPVIRSEGPPSRRRTARPDPAISGILLPISGNGAPASMRKQLFTFSAVLVMVIAASAEEDWHLHGGSQTDQRFSPLNQINEETVSRLGLLWSQELGTSRDSKPRRLSSRASSIPPGPGAWCSPSTPEPEKRNGATIHDIATEEIGALAGNPRMGCPPTRRSSPKRM